MPSRAADPVQGDWPPIPGGLGMKWFLGTWYPTSTNSQIIFSYTTFRPDGKIVYDTGYPPVRYKVVAEYDGYVVLILDNTAPPPPGTPKDQAEHFYDFEVLTPLYATFAQKVGLPTMIEERYCSGRKDGFLGDGKNWQLTKAHFDLSQPELKALWDRYEPCNPVLKRNDPTKRWPWGEYWSMGYYIPYLPIEDHAREAGLSVVPEAAPGDLYRYPARRQDDE